METKVYSVTDISQMRNRHLDLIAQVESSFVEREYAESVMNEVGFVTHADYKALEEKYHEHLLLSSLTDERLNECIEEVSRLTAELAECRKDAERLDWYQNNGENQYSPFFEGGRWWVNYMDNGQGGLGGGVCSAPFDTFREAIDNAIARSHA